MSKGKPPFGVGSDRGGRPLASPTSLFLSFVAPFFIPFRAVPHPFPRTPDLCPFSPSLSFSSLHRWNESGKWRFKLADPAREGPSESIIPHSTRTSLSRNAPHRDAPLHLRVKTSIRACFSVSSFLRKFPVSLRLDLSSSCPPPSLAHPFCPRRAPLIAGSRRRKRSLAILCALRGQGVRVEVASLMEVRCRCPVKFYNYKAVSRACLSL